MVVDSYFSSSDDIYKEKFPDLCDFLKRKTRKCFRLKTITDKLPILKWLPKYVPKWFIQDFVAGLTVGLTSVPQSIAYGVVAGLDPQYGLYSAFMSSFVYIVFGTCKDLTIGPTAIMALMINSHAVLSPDFAVLASFLCGCLMFLLGVLNLGFLIQFISIPVVTGFTAAAAATIGSAQINTLFGIKNNRTNELVDAWINFFSSLDKISLYNALLGVLTLVFLILMRYFKDVKFLPKVIAKYISLARNAFAVIIGIIIAYCLTDSDGNGPFKLTGEIKSGMPPFKLPPFSTTVDGEELSFKDMINQLGFSIVSIALISILDTVTMAKAFLKGKTVDASQEMIAVGICNIMGSFVSALPNTASYTRTALNNASGVRTTLGGAVTGSLILLTLAFLAETFYYIPKATLSAIIISAMIFLVDYDRIREIWNGKRMDILPFIVTFIACVWLGLEYGILVGIGLNLVFIMFASVRPHVDIILEKVNGIGVAYVELRDDLRYSSAEFLKDRIMKFVNKNSEVQIVVIGGENIYEIDSTVGLVSMSLRTKRKTKKFSQETKTYNDIIRFIFPRTSLC
ncbi:SLC26A11.2 family protein [Megaselia abdita]